MKDTVFSKDKGKVFSCFACGGGSTMGYKLAGFDVLGCNEIDPKMLDVYKENHNPKYSFLESIVTFARRKDLPKELYDLDILDGSPPCSSFSMVGNREKDWGKEKIFTEGQELQVLDTLFFDFISLAKELQPKVVIAENVKGLLMGEAKKYVRKIYDKFENAGYYCQHFLLDASRMGVPQKRERVFFIAMRKDIAKPFLKPVDLFTIAPYLDLEFNESEIPFLEIEDFDADVGESKVYPSVRNLYPYVKEGRDFSDAHEKGSFFSYHKVDRNKPLQTITANTEGGCGYHYEKIRTLTKTELKLGGSYPQDYNFLVNKVKYLVGMSVPPVMMAQIAKRIYDQWLSKI